MSKELEKCKNCPGRLDNVCTLFHSYININTYIICLEYDRQILLESLEKSIKEHKALEIIKPLVYIFWNNGDYGEIRLTESGKIIKEYIPKNEYELLKEAGFKEFKKMLL